MIIGMIYGENRPFPPDIRVEKEISALCLVAGYRVKVLTRQLPETAPRREVLIQDLAEVVRIPVRETSSKIVKILNKLQMYEQAWKPALKEFIRNEAPAVLHVHDLLMVPVVLHVASHYGIPVIADLHENMPAAMRAWRSNLPTMQKLRLAFVYNYHLMRWHEARALKRCARVIVVVPEASKRLYQYGISKEKIVVVSNTEDESTFRFRPEDADPQIVARYKPYWVISYVGGMGPHRGLDTVLRGISFLQSSIPNLRLLIVGANAQDRRQIESQVMQLGIGKHVEIIGWQPFSKVNSYVTASDVCLVPHNDFEHTQTTVPHKLFQYMICGKPILVSDCRPLARIINETKAGIIFKANDSEDVARKLRYMHQHPDQLREMGINGQKAALGQYAWRNDAARLVEMYKGLETTIFKPKA